MVQGHKPAGSRDVTGKKNGGQFQLAEAKPIGEISFFGRGDLRAPMSKKWTQPPDASSNTPFPWDDLNAIEDLATGIAIVHEVHDSWIKLSKERNDAMPEEFRSDNGWYRHDKSHAHLLPLGVYFDDLNEATARRLDRDEIIQEIKDYFPDEYEAVTEEVIPEGQSFTRDRARFFDKHKNDWVEYAARGYLTSSKVCVFACRGGRRKKGSPETTRLYDIPLNVYNRRSRFGFVIDEATYRPIEEFTNE